jgi:hypothetical protein
MQPFSNSFKDVLISTWYAEVPAVWVKYTRVVKRRLHSRLLYAIFTQSMVCSIRCPLINNKRIAMHFRRFVTRSNRHDF